MKHILFTVLVTFPILLVAQSDSEKLLQTKYLMAEDGDVIEIPEGTFTLSRSLWLYEGHNITISGAGIG